MLSASENEVPFEPWMENTPRMMRRNRSILLTQLPSIMGLSRKPTNSVGTKLNCFSTYMCSNQPRPKLEAALPDYSSNKFPTTRRPKARILSDVLLEEINKWFEKVGTKIGTAVGDKNQRNMVKRLLFTYSDLNGIELEELVPTDLYVHRVRLKEGTKPFSKIEQKRWPPGKEFWLQKIVNEGLACGIYEKTMSANGKLSDWNAQAEIVEKSENLGPWDEPRITFNYQNVKEEMPGYFLELMSKVHDHVSDPSHQFFLKFDVKHGYWNILVHPEDRHFFAFTISVIGRVQPTCLPQGSMSAGFSFKELIYIVLGDIPAGEDDFPGMKSLLVVEDGLSLPKVSFYIDDMFSGLSNFQDAYNFMTNELFPRLEWARLKLSFKKIELFMDEIVALRTLYKKGGIVYVTPERRDKI